MSFQNYRTHLLGMLVGAAILTLVEPPATALGQSVDPNKPAPMQAGPNDGTVDNMQGANYFYFWIEPGKSTVTASYRNVGTWASSSATTLTVELYDQAKTWVTRATISSLKESNQHVFHGSVKHQTKVILAVIPPSGGLIRMGGDYEVSATGDVKFAKPPNDTELIVGTYSPKLIYSNEDTAVKFLPDGTLQFASGTSGTWKLFDAETHIYTITFGDNRLSLKLIPGRGLVQAADPSTVVFQRTK
jgi:hypothetical protein